ncbi:alanine racemase [Rhizobium sp. KVB221]|uniref:Alanine racemase n=1 Tax=Rhizobium setariae TaxID=2801340 RepID=A0A936YPJ0_9HYPH|nr:alanine racemase [Rhizobium setariae]MBL0370411.1 alanine racemase [Rhizobium setariae]
MTDGAYFEVLGRALREAGCWRPALVIDKIRLDANIDLVKQRLQPGRPVRLADKSLAVLPLLGHLMNRLQTNRIMSFHLPIARAVLSAMPDAEILFGKPMPIGALQHSLACMNSCEREDMSDRVVHLIDSTTRLHAYADLARNTGLRLRFAAEVDVGMHRGGFADPESLRDALLSVAGDPMLKCEGLMGYEAHLSKIPRMLGGADGERRKVVERFNAFVAVFDPADRTILNIGGSLTALGYGGESKANEVSMGSGFLQPTDFEGDELAGLLPALFIATPVLKIVEARLPGPRLLTQLMQKIGRFPNKGCFLYSGKWMAKPAWPADLRENSLWGASSNQQFFALGTGSTLAEGDYAFLRPTQSEAVLQQFGPLLVFENGHITGQWQPLPLG